jgi:hypothetical protein
MRHTHGRPKKKQQACNHGIQRKTLYNYVSHETTDRRIGRERERGTGISARPESPESRGGGRSKPGIDCSQRGGGGGTSDARKPGGRRPSHFSDSFTGFLCHSRRLINIATAWAEIEQNDERSLNAFLMKK